MLTETMFPRGRSRKSNASLYVTLLLLVVIVGGFIASTARVSAPADRELRASTRPVASEKV
jgi:hypothetical protein